MTEVEKWAPVYITTTTPADEAGNFYIPALIPANVTALPARVTDVAPTDDQLAANKPLEFDWLTKTWGPSGEDPVIKQMAALASSYATQTLATKQQLAGIGLQLAKALSAEDKPADDTTAKPADGKPADGTTTTPAENTEAK
ncbi:hypothetical protein PQ472_05270 [Lacticaseibacillus pabuli]|uniref:Bacteriophage SP-beta YorD domain-containing protein n=1 Tax=Lacticaseibacillus pabuli TaxID=3025672 RepID=A0ABY7WVX7_9LACO|nr:hypothetical protein [Lacticaseibacillus sp. KACC 23028]WDF83648.1 hypothetical protein PQ472_05270 [Lacticaseibacillus sp. KACC 23028]